MTQKDNRLGKSAVFRPNTIHRSHPPANQRTSTDSATQPLVTPIVHPITLHFDGPGLAILGATAEVVHSGPPYDVPQSWSKALRSHPVKADGIAYSSRHDPKELCHALFDDTLPVVRELDRETDLDGDWFWELADVYRMGCPPR